MMTFGRLNPIQQIHDYSPAGSTPNFMLDTLDIQFCPLTLPIEAIQQYNQHNIQNPITTAIPQSPRHSLSHIPHRMRHHFIPINSTDSDQETSPASPASTTSTSSGSPTASRHPIPQPIIPPALFNIHTTQNFHQLNQNQNIQQNQITQQTIEQQQKQHELEKLQKKQQKKNIEKQKEKHKTKEKNNTLKQIIKKEISKGKQAIRGISIQEHQSQQRRPSPIPITPQASSSTYFSKFRLENNKPSPRKRQRQESSPSPTEKDFFDQLENAHKGVDILEEIHKDDTYQYIE